VRYAVNGGGTPGDVGSLGGVTSGGVSGLGGMRGSGVGAGRSGDGEVGPPGGGTSGTGLWGSLKTNSFWLAA